MSILPPFDYRRLGDFTYHVLTDPEMIKTYLLKWIMREWKSDHQLGPEEHWTVKWMNALPHMEFRLEVIPLKEICPNPDLWSVEIFQKELKERADEREESILRGISIEPLLVDKIGFELMDGYTRYVVLKRYEQKEVFVYLGSFGLNDWSR